VGGQPADPRLPAGAGFGGEDLAFRRQLERAAYAVEQANTQFKLQRMDLPRGRGLADVELGRRAAEPPGFGGRDGRFSARAGSKVLFHLLHQFYCNK
jgi:hypothetical protein